MYIPIYTTQMATQLRSPRVTRLEFVLFFLLGFILLLLYFFFPYKFSGFIFLDLKVHANQIFYFGHISQISPEQAKQPETC